MALETQKILAICEQMRSAMNQHDLDAFLECFDASYQSEQPAHPDRQFSGREQVRKNWSGIFQNIPEFRAELLRSAAAGEVVWAEWDWQGQRPDETQFHMRGVTIMGVKEGRIVWGRLYMEPVEEAGLGIDASMKDLTRGSASGAG